jgi:hypothetical protein
MKQSNWQEIFRCVAIVLTLCADLRNLERHAGVRDVVTSCEPDCDSILEKGQWLCEHAVRYRGEGVY